MLIFYYRLHTQTIYMHSGLGIRSFAHHSFAHLLILLICSFRSNQMSDCERFAQIAQDKWATRERITQVAQRKWAICSGRWEVMSEWAIRSKNFGQKILNLVIFNMFYIRFFFKLANRSFPLFWWAMWVNRSGHSPKMSDVSKSLSSLTKNEWPWAIGTHRSEEMSDCERIA